jgi:hypothetical protein
MWHTYIKRARAHARTHARTHTHTHTHTHARTHARTRARTHTNTHTHTHRPVEVWLNDENPFAFLLEDVKEIGHDEKGREGGGEGGGGGGGEHAQAVTEEGASKERFV